MNRRSFVSNAVAAALGVFVGGWSALRTRLRVFPGRLRRLDDTKWREPGKWLG